MPSSGNLSELPISVPFSPMEARNVAEIPKGAEWRYEPKWDGFRCLAFRNGSEIELQSKSSQSLTRYFPELADALRALKPKQFVLDGEAIILIDGKLSFDDLLQRIHPAASRVAKLSRDHPARFVLFDLLVDDKGRSLLDKPFDKRREALEQFASRHLSGHDTFVLSPHTDEIAVARGWMKTMRGQLDGLVAKNAGLPYLSGERAMSKIKTLRTADCVVGGFRYLDATPKDPTGAKHKPRVGSLLLGLYDEDGLLNHVGFTSSLSSEERPALTKKLEALIEPPGFTGRAPGGPSRWNSGKSHDWQPLRPELVVEVRYDHFTGNRFRHGTGLLRWRPDKAPRQCRMDQVEHKTKSPLSLLA